MNCENCGATMRLVDKREFFICDFCGGFHFPICLNTIDDSVKILGDESNHDCPVCPDCITLIAGSVHGHRVHYCKKCRGVLTFNEGFLEIVKTIRAHHEGPDDKPSPLDPREYERTIRCPMCDQIMEAHPYYGPGNVIIDTCNHCRAVWLDHGELRVIQKAPGRR